MTRVFIVVGLVLTAMSAHAQKGARSIGPVEPLIIDVDLRELAPLRSWQPGDPIIDIPRVGSEDMSQSSGSQLPRRDPLLDLTARGAPDPTFTTPLINVAGIGYTGVSVPDPVGAVGARYYIQATNGNSGMRYTVFHKEDGSFVAGPFDLDQLAEDTLCDAGAGDGIVLYDALARRWILSEFPPAFDGFCVYVSRTDDPVTGGFYAYSFQVEAPDYPKYGVWPDAYYVTSNEAFQLEPKLYAMDRAAMLAGQPASLQVVELPHLQGFSFDAATPADLDGRQSPPPGSPGIAMRHRDDEEHDQANADPSRDFLEIWTLAVDWNDPNETVLTGPIDIAVSEFDSFFCGSTSCVPMPGTTIKLDNIREVIMHRLVYRRFGADQLLVGSFVTDADGEGRAAVRWFVLRKTGGGDWTLLQEGTYGPDTDHRWMSSIAMDKRGNIAMGFNISSSTTFPGLRYTGRRVQDPLGTMTMGDTILGEGTSRHTNDRYGDYTAMTIDPIDDCTFWYTGQFNPAPQWQTRIAAFRFDDCPSCDLPVAIPAWQTGDLISLIICINQNL